MAIFLITAPSGAGKTTIAQHLEKVGIWKECISHTTRAMRNGEVNGETYYFVSKGEFSDMYRNGEFAEFVEYDGNRYGVSKKEIALVLNATKHLFVIVEYNGYKQMKAIYPDAVGIFLYMDKENCMANMLLRGDKLEKAIDRIGTYDDEMKNRNEYDYVIKNVQGQLETTATVIRHIVRQYN